MTRQQAPVTVNGDVRTRPVLLIADPDRTVVDEVANALEREGVAVTGAPDGAQGLLQAGALQPDVVLVSATIAVIDAVEFVRAVRRARAVPVLLGVGEGHAEQAVRALAAGAAACVARPYRVPELLPFIHAASPESRDVLHVGGVELDVQAYQVRVGGRTVHLPLREFELLQYLMRNADRTVTREQIMRHVWHTATTTSTNTIAVHVKRLRARLGDEDDQLIQTVRGVGYRLVTPSISGSPA
ncbi:winged helix-turn-helix transcriptional regulator [Nonomuraea wenchangensis]|uniref:DNA-binding response regulator, OmpR family, contains REC and winged-helix (WHTH) domain n=1 Tax=Nonomuraea wenchangensis TaxID=568860 RepID=A0A1I0DNH8_9ACTN|nr:response regulator transcription factor [Nonomuraea wenchangensis]SET33674.1 DNA-binding response regulator, OmpR family, contains REC and winged-helix (wHTH) domain [Nonomuraea wenchangensis]